MMKNQALRVRTMLRLAQLRFFLCAVFVRFFFIRPILEFSWRSLFYGMIVYWMCGLSVTTAFSDVMRIRGVFPDSLGESGPLENRVEILIQPKKYPILVLKFEEASFQKQELWTQADQRCLQNYGEQTVATQMLQSLAQKRFEITCQDRVEEGKTHQRGIATLLRGVSQVVPEQVSPSEIALNVCRKSSAVRGISRERTIPFSMEDGNPRSLFSVACIWVSTIESMPMGLFQYLLDFMEPHSVIELASRNLFLMDKVLEAGEMKRREDPSYPAVVPVSVNSLPHPSLRWGKAFRISKGEFSHQTWNAFLRSDFFKTKIHHLEFLPGTVDQVLQNFQAQAEFVAYVQSQSQIRTLILPNFPQNQSGFGALRITPGERGWPDIDLALNQEIVDEETFGRSLRGILALFGNKISTLNFSHHLTHGERVAEVLNTIEDLDLMTLGLNRTHIGFDGIQAFKESLKGVQSLTTLGLDECHIGIEGGDLVAKWLKEPQLSNVASLRLGYNGLSPIQVHSVIKALPFPEKIRELNFEGNPLELNANGAEAVQEALRSVPNLEQLNLSASELLGPPVGDPRVVEDLRNLDGLSTLVHGWNWIQKLKGLSLSTNNLRDRGVEVVANGFRFLSELRYLDLTANRIGSQGGKSIAKNLNFLPKLIELRLASNELGQEGVIALLDRLKTQAVFSLEALDLYGNRMGPISQEVLTESLRRVPKLKTFRFGWNLLGLSGLTAVAQSLKCVPLLQNLDLGENYQPPVTSIPRPVSERVFRPLALNQQGMGGRFSDSRPLKALRYEPESPVSNELRTMMAALITGLQHVPDLRTLNLESNHLGQIAVGQLLRKLLDLSYLPHLRTLKLVGNNFDSNLLKSLLTQIREERPFLNMVLKEDQSLLNMENHRRDMWMME